MLGRCDHDQRVLGEPFDGCVHFLRRRAKDIKIIGIAGETRQQLFAVADRQGDFYAGKTAL